MQPQSSNATPVIHRRNSAAKFAWRNVKFGITLSLYATAHTWGVPEGCVMGQFIDPFGAPEFMVEGVAFREFMGTEFIKLGWCAMENGQCLLRFKAIIPVQKIVYEHTMTKAFLNARMAREVGSIGAVLM